MTTSSPEVTVVLGPVLSVGHSRPEVADIILCVNVRGKSCTSQEKQWGDIRISCQTNVWVTDLYANHNVNLNLVALGEGLGALNQHQKKSFLCAKIKKCLVNLRLLKLDPGPRQIRILFHQ